MRSFTPGQPSSPAIVAISDNGSCLSPTSFASCPNVSGTVPAEGARTNRCPTSPRLCVIFPGAVAAHLLPFLGTTQAAPPHARTYKRAAFAAFRDEQRSRKPCRNPADDIAYRHTAAVRDLSDDKHAPGGEIARWRCRQTLRLALEMARFGSEIARK